MTLTKLMLIDDAPMVHQWLPLILAGQDDMHLVGTAHRTADALEMYRHELPHVVICDWEFTDEPGVNGGTVIKELLKFDDRARVIVSTFHTDPRVLQIVRQMGACGFVHKNRVHSQLVPAIQAVRVGGAFFDESFEALGPHSVDVGGAVVTVTAREMDVLRGLVAGLRNKDIADRLSMSVETVKSHLRNLSKKLDAKGRHEIMVRALEYGLVDGLAA